jgi:DNA-binding transcriptional LysR family regulator
MDIRKLAKMDLNLLISLQVLLEERSVSRAAQRLFITQPAMSKTLSRLRELFQDPLFTRSSHGMQPTPRALELAPGLNQILGNVRELVSGSEFDPAAATGEITLAMSEYIGLALVPALIAKLQAQAPGLSLRIVTRAENQLEQLALGNLDFAFHMEQSHYSADYRVKHLGGGPPAVLTRLDHPLTREEPSWQRLAAFPVIRLYVPDWEQVALERDANMEAIMRGQQQSSLEISHLLTALEVLRSSDFFMLGPAYLVQNEQATRGIKAIPLPKSKNHAINYVLVAHNRTANSPLHNWLWQEITCTIRELNTPQIRKMRQRIAAGATHPPQQ